MPFCGKVDHYSEEKKYVFCFTQGRAQNSIIFGGCQLYYILRFIFFSTLSKICDEEIHSCSSVLGLNRK
jgi:hypothetical protein